MQQQQEIQGRGLVPHLMNLEVQVVGSIQRGKQYLLRCYNRIANGRWENTELEKFKLKKVSPQTFGVPLLVVARPL